MNTGSPQHNVAHAALQAAYRAGSVALAWSALLDHVRQSTRSGILPRPLKIDQALNVMQSWLDHSATVLVQPTAQHAAVLGRLLMGAGQGGPLVSDAHLAAIAIEHRATLLSFDRDFERFAGLRLTLLR
ncbi:MAG: TA system VapC family ribonuclease toxin [Aquabacterium sp.]